MHARRSACFASSHFWRRQLKSGVSHHVNARRTTVSRDIAGTWRYGCTRAAIVGTSVRADAVMDAKGKETEKDDEEDEYERETFRVTETESGLRLDKMLANRFSGRSRSYMQSLITDGEVEVGGERAVKSTRTRAGEVVAVRLVPTERELPLVPEALELEVLYEDEDVVVINKAAGMVVHPGAGNWHGTLVHGLTHRYETLRTLGGPRPGIVHRLDKGTSGALVVGKTASAATRLAELFAARAVEKEYVAVTVGNPAGQGCIGRVIDEPIGRSPRDRLRMTVLGVEAGGKESRSEINVVAADDRGLLHCVSVRIATGRTHQIRVHLRHVRAPVLGDDLYGAPDINHRFRTAAPRPMLHARRIVFRHPVSDEIVDISAPLPQDFRELLGRVVYPEYEQRWGE